MDRGPDRTVTGLIGPLVPVTAFIDHPRSTVLPCPLFSRDWPGPVGTGPGPIFFASFAPILHPLLCVISGTIGHDNPTFVPDNRPTHDLMGAPAMVVRQ